MTYLIGSNMDIRLSISCNTINIVMEYGTAHF